MTAENGDHIQSNQISIYLPYVKMSYIFRRITYLTEDGFCKELVSLLYERELAIDGNVSKEFEFEVTDSRELELQSMPKHVQKSLSKEAVLRENFDLTRKQYKKIKETYRYNLIAVNTNILEKYK